MSKNTYMQSFMEQFPHEGLTFDDVSLVTQYANFLPDDTDITSRLTTRINVNMPFVSAAMDTVTESNMAIAMAMLGGIGVIHKNLSAKIQAKYVSAVKHYLNGLILDPIVFHSSDTLEIVRQEKERRGFKFSGFPILNEKENLVGILTSTDIKFSKDRNARVTDVMTSKVITAPEGTSLQEAYNIMMRNKIGKLPR